MILCMIVTALTVTATVHAREDAGPSAMECSGYVHSDGDRDQTQGDSDQAVPHHHGGCQGAASLVPGKIITPTLFDLSAGPRLMATSAVLAPWTPGPNLRPPIA